MLFQFLSGFQTLAHLCAPFDFFHPLILLNNQKLSLLVSWNLKSCPATLILSHPPTFLQPDKLRQYCKLWGCPKHCCQRTPSPIEGRKLSCALTTMLQVIELPKTGDVSHQLWRPERITHERAILEWITNTLVKNTPQVCIYIFLVSMSADQSKLFYLRILIRQWDCKKNVFPYILSILVMMEQNTKEGGDNWTITGCISPLCIHT